LWIWNKIKKISFFARGSSFEADLKNLNFFLLFCRLLWLITLGQNILNLICNQCIGKPSSFKGFYSLCLSKDKASLEWKRHIFLIFFVVMTKLQDLLHCQIPFVFKNFGFFQIRLTSSFAGIEASRSWKRRMFFFWWYSGKKERRGE